MENLVRKLQEEIGLSQDDAIRAVSLVKDYLDKQGVDVDWDKLFKEKSEDFIDKAKGVFSNVAKHTQSYTDKIVDKIDSFADKARKGAKDMFDEN